MAAPTIIQLHPPATETVRECNSELIPSNSKTCMLPRQLVLKRLLPLRLSMCWRNEWWRECSIRRGTLRDSAASEHIVSLASGSGRAVGGDIRSVKGNVRASEGSSEHSSASDMTGYTAKKLFANDWSTVP
jgi:hypothetical protein